MEELKLVFSEASDLNGRQKRTGPSLSVCVWDGSPPCAGPQQTDRGDFNTWTLCVSQTIEEKEEEKEEEDSFTEKETPEAKPRTAAETKPAQSRKKNWTDRKKK